MENNVSTLAARRPTIREAVRLVVPNNEEMRESVCNLERTSAQRLLFALNNFPSPGVTLILESP
jgi:hypothetical protein